MAVWRVGVGGGKEGRGNQQEFEPKGGETDAGFTTADTTLMYVLYTQLGIWLLKASSMLSVSYFWKALFQTFMQEPFLCRTERLKTFFPASAEEE